jgi:hypothetical protein
VLVTAIREQTAKLDDLSDKMSTVEVSMGSMEEVKPALMDLALWKPHMDHAVGALQADLSDLRTHMDHLVGALQPPTTAAVPSAAASGNRRVDPRGDASRGVLGDEGHPGPNGHRVNTTARGSLMGPAPFSTPAKGTFPVPSDSPSFPARDRDRDHGNTPRVDCPSFSREGPLDWKLRCESYFRMCRIDKDLWVDTSVVHFIGEAALWL